MNYPRPPLLRVDDISTSFHTPRGRYRAVDGVSLDLDEGETIGIVGESGSGKSVFARSIMNLLPPSATVDGRVTFRGRDVLTLPRAEKRHFWGPEIAMVFQDPMTSLNPVKRIGVQITDPVRFHLGADRAAAHRRAVELLELVGIPDPVRRMDQYPHELSGGMRQRIVIAIALSCRPKLLIADEPTTALDVTMQKQILDLLTALQRELGMAMILISHDLGVVATRTRSVRVMYSGRIVESARTTALYAGPRHPYTSALLSSIPRIGEPSHTRLHTIPGRPPDMVDPPPGCRFEARCSYAHDACRHTQPELVGASPDHLHACLLTVGTAEADAVRLHRTSTPDRIEATT